MYCFDPSLVSLIALHQLGWLLRIHQDTAIKTLSNCVNTDVDLHSASTCTPSNSNWNGKEHVVVKLQPLSRLKGVISF